MCGGPYSYMQMAWPRPVEDKLSYLVGQIIILSKDSPDIG